MKKSTAAILFIIALLFSACTDHVYAPALYKTDIAYQYKPMSSDAVKNANYISGSLNVGNAVNQSDVTFIGRAGLGRANTFNNFNLAYGAYGFLGDYQNTSIQNNQLGYFTNKYLSGLGLRLSADVYIPSGRADLRLLGIEASYSKEFGPYANFRKYAQSLPYFYTDTNISLLTAGFTSEIIWHERKDINTQYGYRLFVGSILGKQNFSSGYDPGNNYNPYINNRDLSISLAFLLNANRAHLVVEGQNFSTFTVGFGYRL